MKRVIIFILLSIVLGLTSGCADHIVSQCEECSPIEGEPKLNTFSGIQTKLFNTTCALSGCHGENATQANLLLTEGEAYSNLVNQQSFLFPDFTRVTPGDSENSLLIKVLRGEAVQMPPTGKLSDDIIDSVALWIDNGALNN
ncbi:MAG: hypothetical protein U5K00_08475 [Melioribacteraceae bacterium]|nr:hypothetical protein [Melioribacteraceae bacterium]